MLFSFSFILRKVRHIPVFFSTSLGEMWLPGLFSCEQIKFSIRFIFFGGYCSLSAWASSSIHRIIFLKSFQKCVDGKSIPTFCWMLLTNFVSIPSSFKKIIQWQLLLRWRTSWFPQSDTNWCEIENHCE